MEEFPMKKMRLFSATVLTAAALFAGCGGGGTAAPRVEASDIDEMLESGVLLLDVRTDEELAEHGTIEGFRHIPIDELEARIGELPKGVPILTA